MIDLKKITIDRLNKKNENVIVNILRKLSFVPMLKRIQEVHCHGRRLTPSEDIFRSFVKVSGGLYLKMQNNIANNAQ